MSNNGNEFLRGKPKDAKDEQLFNFIMKAVTLAAIFTGIWLGTNSFAKFTGYDSGWVGSPFYVIQIRNFIYPLYSPLLIFYWSLVYFRQAQIHEILYNAWKITGWVSVSAIAFYFFVEFILMKYLTQNIFGTARWANKKDLEKAGLLQAKSGIVLGQLADAEVFSDYDPVKQSVILHQKKPSQKIIQGGIYNNSVSAQTRSGKGVSIVQPTLLTYPGSLIVLDYKAESFNYTSGYRAKFSRVYRWAPTGDAGHHFNPLDEIPSGEEAFSFANLIADILTTPASGGGNATSEHFQVGAKDILTGVILHCKFSDWKNKSLPGCVEFLAQGDPVNPDNNKYLWDLMISSDHGDEILHQAVVEIARAQRNRPNDEGASMLSTVNNALAVFKDPIIKRNTMKCRSPFATQIYIRKEQAVYALQTAMRWTPNRIIFGEVRSGEVVVELLQAFISGHPGITTIHAENAASTIPRIEGLLRQIIKGRLPDLSENIQLIVHLADKAGTGPFVNEVLTVKEIQEGKL